MAYLGPSSASLKGALLCRHRLPRCRHRPPRAMGKRPSGLGRFPGFPARAFARVESRAARLTVFPVYGLSRYRSARIGAVRGSVAACPAGAGPQTVASRLNTNRRRRGILNLPRRLRTHADLRVCARMLLANVPLHKERAPNHSILASLSPTASIQLVRP